MNETLTAVLIELGLYALLTITYTLLSGYKNINIWGMSWDWKLWINGVLKYVLVGLSVLAVAASAYITLELLPKFGVSIEGMESISPILLLGILATAVVYLITKNFQAIAKVFGVTEKQLAELTKTVKVDPTNPTKGEVTVAPVTLLGTQDPVAGEDA